MDDHDNDIDDNDDYGDDNGDGGDDDNHTNPYEQQCDRRTCPRWKPQCGGRCQRRCSTR